ncbi:hypothetical protein GQ457_12G004750 [Hibiscus cannabinus]
MGDTKEASANSCGEIPTGRKTCKKSASEKRKWEPFRQLRKLHRHAFSDTSSVDITSFRSEVDEDCSTITTECIEPNEESTGSAESIESETTSSNKASVSSYSEPQNGLAQIVQWQGFLRILKKGAGISSQPAYLRSSLSSLEKIAKDLEVM